MARASASSATADDALKRRVAAVRHFNRFYTRQIGLLREGMLGTPYSLTQLRVLYELAQGPETTATDLARKLDLDHGYLSRILRGFADQGLLARRSSPHDRRQTRLSLTAKGRATFKPIDRRSEIQVGMLMRDLPPVDQSRLVAAMRDIEQIVGRCPDDAEIVLRQHRPGDMGWVVESHGRLYAQEYGFDLSFEALVADIVASFVNNYDSERERCWIAEMGEKQVGSVFLVKQSDEVAKLRLLIVDPRARGRGVGARLTRECVDFARHCGYRILKLWTQSNLLAARHIYERAGFRLIAEEPHRSFGQDLVGETWELTLS